MTMFPGSSSPRSDPKAGATLALGADMSVHRLGYGAMQITGPGVWGPPSDPQGALTVLRRAVELGVDLVDTADSYGPEVSEDLVREALHPYHGVHVATKGGFVRTGPGQWVAVGLPEYLTQCVEMSLRRLRLQTIDLYQLHRIDARVPLADQLGRLRELQLAGKIRHLGLSEVSVDQIVAAREIAPIASVQNLYNLTNRASEEVLRYCQTEGIAFIPWFPLGTGRLTRPGGPLDALAAGTGHTPAQLALAWLLQRSPVMAPIPGTKTLAHLEENVAAASVRLDADTVAALDALR